MEPRRVDHIRRADSVDVRRADVPLGIEQGVPLVLDPLPSQLDHRQLNDPMAGLREKARGLAIDDRYAVVFERGDRRVGGSLEARI